MNSYKIWNWFNNNRSIFSAASSALARNIVVQPLQSQAVNYHWKIHRLQTLSVARIVFSRKRRKQQPNDYRVCSSSLSGFFCLSLCPPLPWIYLFNGSGYVYIYSVSVRRPTRSPVDGRSAYGIKRSSWGCQKGCSGAFIRYLPKAKLASLSKGCLSYARISDARGISLVLRECSCFCVNESADATRTEEFLFQEIQYTGQGNPLAFQSRTVRTVFRSESPLFSAFAALISVVASVEHLETTVFRFKALFTFDK